VSRKVIVIGAGIAGLCAGVYARRCGYDTVVLDMHAETGGLATSWKRGEYTFETCLHWLLGSNPSRPMYGRWREVFDIDQLKFIQPEEYVCLEDEQGARLSIYADVERLEAELLAKAPQDRAEIRRFTTAVRKFGGFRMPEFTAKGGIRARDALASLPYLPALRRWSGMTCEEYGRRFNFPLLRSFFGEGEMAQLSAVAIVLTLAWMNQRDAGYPIGGSRAVIGLIEERLRGLGGELRLKSRVGRILVENDKAVGVQLEGGETLRADWVLSAADGHETIFDLLGGHQADQKIQKLYNTRKLFPSYLQVSLGIHRDLSDTPGFLAKDLPVALQVDPGTLLRRISFRIFNFDPTFAPVGRTAVTCFLPTYNYQHWMELTRQDAVRYGAEKQRIASAVVDILERIIPGVTPDVEVVDVSTPASVIRYTGNWHGSMEGWMMTPGMGYRPLRNTLPKLDRFLMAGQWVIPGGGLPSGLLSARCAVEAMCGRDGVAFSVAAASPTPARQMSV
jgi:phytoene dehydrogenase-like protein